MQIILGCLFLNKMQQALDVLCCAGNEHCVVCKFDIKERYGRGYLMGIFLN